MTCISLSVFLRIPPRSSVSKTKISITQDTDGILFAVGRLQDIDHKASAAYVQGAYIAGQLTILCLAYTTSGTDQPKLMPFSISGF